MNNIAKKPYKITLWEDKNVYIVGGQRKYIVDENDVVQNQFLEENCIATIGSNTMDTPIRAVNPVLTEDLNGSKTLTFQIYMRYWDDEEEDWKPNPFINLLVNERRVKLKYGSDEWNEGERKWDEQDPWIDFVIKQVTEDSEGETISVTCKDLFINELGKTGYEVELDTELQNNMGTVTELAEKILENTDWRVGNSEHLFQRHKEALFEYIMEDGFFSQIEELTVQPFGSEKIHRDIVTNSLVGKKIYIFYSCVSEKEDKVQFLYDVNSYDGGPNDGKPIVDEYGFIRKTIKAEDNSGNEIEEDVYYEAIFTSEQKDVFYGQFLDQTGYLDGSLISNYFGEKLVQKQKSKYFPQIGETCYLYSKNGQEYWCYTNSEYLSSSEIQNLLSNTNNFTSTDGWKTEDENGNTTADLEIREVEREYTPGVPVTVKIHNEYVTYYDRVARANGRSAAPGQNNNSSVSQEESPVQTQSIPTTFSLNRDAQTNENDETYNITLDNYGPFALLSAFSPRGFVPGDEYILGAKINAVDVNDNNYTALGDIFDFIGLSADKWEKSTSNSYETGVDYYSLNENTGEFEKVEVPENPEQDDTPINKKLYEKKVVELLDFSKETTPILLKDIIQGEDKFDTEGTGDYVPVDPDSPALTGINPHECKFYEYDNGSYKLTEDITVDQNKTYYKLNTYDEFYGYTFSSKGYVPTGDEGGISYAEMCKVHGNMRLNSRAKSNIKQIDITDMKLFPAQTNNDGLYFVPDSKDSLNENLNNAIIKIRYNFFPEDTDMDLVYGKEDLHLSASIVLPLNGSITEKGYNPIMVDDYGKVTSITGSKSNRFNLIQMLCEAFECWAKFDIEHDETGRILYEYKKIEDKEQYENGGLYYIYTENEELPNKSSNDLLFEVDHGTFDKDNYNQRYKRTYHKYVTFKEFIGDDNPVGFRYGINLKSIERNIISDQIATKVIVQPNSNEFAPNGSCTIQQSALNPTGENALYNFQFFINHELIDIQSLYDDLYGRHGGMGFFTKLKQWNNDITDPINNLATINNAICNLESKQTVYDTAIDEANKKISKLQTEIQGAGGAENSYVAGKITEQDTLYSSIHNYESLSSSNKRLLDKYQEQSRQISNKLKEIENKKKRLNADFHRKYFRFIQEGTWTSEDYYDPELYFQAANEVLYTSAFPQISYTINVLELSQLEGFEPYTFKIADKTYIEDTEFFGYDYQGRPYKEEIVVSQIVSNLDDPSLNTITVQNYKTQFQDLFQRIAAASQSLQYAEGEYKRASGAVNPDGTINSSLMQNSLMDNELIIKNAKNQAVTWDETGISISNFKDAANVVRLTSDGIVLTNDGGLTWTTGITGSGINASVITTGRLDTDRIRIFSDGMQTFEWNGKGLSAFAKEELDNGSGNTVQNGINYNKYVRFDQYGVYGYLGDYSSSGDYGNPGNDIDTVIQNTVFSLTWKGLTLNSTNNQDYLHLSTEGGGTGETWIVKSSSGDLIYSETIQGNKIIWAGSKITESGNNNEVEKDNFIVTDKGILYSNGGVFSGDIYGSAIYGGEIHIGPIDGTNYHFNVGSTGDLTIQSAVNGTTFKVEASTGKVTSLSINSSNNNGSGTIISTPSSSGSQSKFDITCAEGDFSGTFSGLINTDRINLYKKQDSWSNKTVVPIKEGNNIKYYELYDNNNNKIDPGAYMIINEAQSATNTGIALEIHSNGAGRFRAEEGNLYFSTKSNISGENGKEYYFMLTNDGKIQTNCSTIQTSTTGEAKPSGSTSGGTTLDNTAVFG